MTERPVEYLESETRRLLDGCRIQADDETDLYTPDVSGHYAALWTRDFAYMVEYAGDLIPSEHIDACIRYLVSGQGADGWIPDRVRADGMAIYTAGPDDKPLGRPNLDNAAFLTIAVGSYLRTLDEDTAAERYHRWADAMALGLGVMPIGDAGLIWNDPARPHSPYGFTDTVRKTGHLLMESLLFWRACRIISERNQLVGMRADQWDYHVDRIQAGVGVLWDDTVGAFLAASGDCRQIDIWGNAYALSIGFPLGDREDRVRRFLADNIDRYSFRGQIRHLLAGEYWQRLFTGVKRDTYQNGAYWATATGWVATAIAPLNPDAARKLILDAIADFRENDIAECIGPRDRQLPGYVVSATNVLAAARRLFEQ